MQGLAGGCAFVRSTFDMLGDTVAYNGGDGIRIVNYANNYGAIYAVSGRTKYTANMVLDKVYVGRNNGAGLSSTTRVNNESFAYNYIVALNSTLSYNRGSGFQTFAGAYGNSAIVEKTCSTRSPRRFRSATMAAWGSTLPTSPKGQLCRRPQPAVGKSTGVNASNNGGFGIRVQVSYADASSLAHQRSYIYGSTFNSMAMASASILSVRRRPEIVFGREHGQVQPVRRRLWRGEFRRLPVCEGPYGREHGNRQRHQLPVQCLRRFNAET